MRTGTIILNQVENIQYDADGYAIDSITDADGVVRLAVDAAEVKSSSATVSSVVSSTSTVTILAANANRLGASVQNDSNKDMYLKIGSGASTTSFTVLIERDFHYEVPFSYTGILTAVWETGVSGSARVTEFTT